MRAAMGSVVMAWAVAVSLGCATPAARLDELARAATLERAVLHCGEFRHLAYFRQGRGRPDRLHVYIEHDGVPWTARGISADPTPRNPLAMRLLMQDPASSLYIGRPCHFALDPSPPCHPLLWTHARYGEEIVSAMAQAIEGFAVGRGYGELVLIGYSGGGTLAVLLAERLQQTVAVVTVAANLDVAAWARSHGYSPLEGSLNPADRSPLNAALEQRHYVGSADPNVPPALVQRYARRHPAARVVELAEFDHVCCWVSAWPAILAEPPLR